MKSILGLLGPKAVHLLVRQRRDVCVANQILWAYRERITAAKTVYAASLCQTGLVGIEITHYAWLHCCGVGKLIVRARGRSAKGQLYAR